MENNRSINNAMACWLRRCHDCNYPLGKKDLFCPRCGARQRRDKLAYRRCGGKRCYAC